MKRLQFRTKNGPTHNIDPEPPVRKPGRFRVRRNHQGHPVSEIAIAAGKRRFAVMLEYDPSKVTGIGELLMESIGVRGIHKFIPQPYTIEDAFKYIKCFAWTPANIVAGSEDCWHAYIYAVEYMRMHGTKEQQRQANYSDKQVNPDYDNTKENIKQDGRTWGSIDMEDFIEPTGERGLSYQEVPVREQVQERQAAVIEAHRSSLTPVDLDKVRESANAPEEQKWEVAVGLARKARSVWEGKIDWEMEQRVKYCYGWLRDIGSIPLPYPADLTCLFWPISKVFGNNEQDNQRREFITGKIMGFWRRGLAQNEIDTHSESYRVTLAAMELSALIEEYVGNPRRVDHEHTLNQLDAVTITEIKSAAQKYFQAHIPVSHLGAAPGPISTLDPTFVDYIRLCKKYDIPTGTLLHTLQI